MMGSASGGRPNRDKHFHLELDQLGSKGGEPLVVPLPIPPLDDKVLALHVAEVAQFLIEGLQIGRRSGGMGHEQADARGFHGLRRLGGEQRHKESEGKHRSKPDSMESHSDLLLSTW